MRHVCACLCPQGVQACSHMEFGQSVMALLHQDVTMASGKDSGAAQEQWREACILEAHQGSCSVGSR